MTLLLVVGPYCPIGVTDYRKRLLRCLLRSKHKIVAMIAAENDSLISFAQAKKIQVHPCLSEFNQSRSRIQVALTNPQFQIRLTEWLAPLKQEAPDLGICFYGNWLPPVIFALPTRGFLNFHPGPLPELRGMEPDTFAVLEGRIKMHGTVHFVAEEFDQGAIVATTPELQLTPHMLPYDVDRALGRMGVITLLRAIADIDSGSAMCRAQELHRATSASRQRARQWAYLNFVRDDAAMIDRRRRAFLSQNIGIRLKIWIGNRCYEVIDVETWTINIAGAPGTLLGHYQGRGAFAGAPLFRTADGLAVVRLGDCFVDEAAERAAHSPLPHPEVRFESDRPRQTDWVTIMRSLATSLKPVYL